MKIKITKDKLTEAVRESISRILNEERTITQYEVDGYVVSVKDYNMENPNDKQFLKSNKKLYGRYFKAVMKSWVVSRGMLHFQALLRRQA